MKQYPGYTLVRTEPCPEQHGTLTLLTHDISGDTIETSILTDKGATTR